MRAINMYAVRVTMRVLSGIRKELQAFKADEEGVGVIELVLILVVLISLVTIFKTKITELMSGVFTEINEAAEAIY